MSATMHKSQNRTVRDAVFSILRERGITRIFANPGSTEISLLADFPDDLEFVLALHEGSVVGIATGHALAHRQPALALVHTTAGLGNAIGAIATARGNRAPIVVLVGQQDRRHLATEPFLAGKLRDLAGEYPVWFNEPVTAQDVPAAIARAVHEAQVHRGPAIVVVPMDDWEQLIDPAHFFSAPGSVRTGHNIPDDALANIADRINAAKHPVMIAGAGNDTAEGWLAATMLAEHLRFPVFQESFAAQAGFPQDHPQFAGFLSSSRSSLRSQLEPFDLIFAVGAPVFRQYNFEAGPMFSDNASVVVITEEPDEALRSPASVALIGDIADALSRLLPLTSARVADASTVLPAALTPPEYDEGQPLRASHVMAALATRISDDTIIVEETPSSRPDLHALLPARKPLGFLSAAMGGLGFALPATVGLRMANPKRPTVAIIGDGSSLYSVQALWTARYYAVGCLFIILRNGRYAVMERLAEKFGSGGPAWPAFTEIDFPGLSRSFGVDTEHISSHAQLLEALDEIVPTLQTRTTPLTLIVDVEPELTFAP